MFYKTFLLCIYTLEVEFLPEKNLALKSYKWNWYFLREVIKVVICSSGIHYQQYSVLANWKKTS